MKTINFIRQSVAAALIIVAVALAGCGKDDPETEKAPVRVSGVSLNKSTLALAEGGSETLVATVAPENAENKAVTWKSDRPDIAAVDAEGKVTAVKAGTAAITVTATDGGKTATCAVTVNAATVTGVTLDKTELTLLVDASETLTATVAPDNAGDKTVEWSSSDENVAAVDAGKVTAVAVGTAVITVTTKDGSKTAACAVTVNEQITMTTITATGTVGLYLAGSGKAVIDWGDGSEPETVTLMAPDNGELHGSHSYYHAFSGSTGHTIVIQGQNITHLDCSFRNLTSLDVTKNTALTYLLCKMNMLETLDVSKNTALTWLECDENSLEALDVSNNTALTYLMCGINSLKALDVSKNTALTELWCEDNYLTSLDLTANTALVYVNCSENQLTAEGLNTLFGTLNNTAVDKNIYVYSNPGNYDCDDTIAQAKGWTVDH